MHNTATVTATTRRATLTTACVQGIVGASWSPSQDLLLVVTGEGRLLAMTTSWDVLAERDGPAISVASTTAEPQLSQRAVHVRWRGDGQYVVVRYHAIPHVTPCHVSVTHSPSADATLVTDSTLDTDGTRRVRVWTRDLELHAEGKWQRVTPPTCSLTLTLTPPFRRPQ